MEEDEIKALEEEIDSAVDQLFVEKKLGSQEKRLLDSPCLESPIESQTLDTPLEKSILEHPYGLYPASSSIPDSKSFDKMESQLLSLEWEITKENIEKAKEEVLSLKKIWIEKSSIFSVLGLMEKVLNFMMNNLEKIRSPLIKFLLDSKETIKLLTREETEGEINIYKQLAYAGIEARFLCLEEFQDMKIKPIRSPSGTSSFAEPSSATKEILNTAGGQEGGISNGAMESFMRPKEGADWVAISGERGEEVEEITRKIDLFCQKMDGALQKMDQYLSRLSEQYNKFSRNFHEASTQSVEITVFKVDERLFGVESSKILRLFKIPYTFRDKVSNYQRIQLKNVNLKVVDLKQIFSIPGEDRKGEMRILTVKGNGEYKGLIVDQVLKQVTCHTDPEETPGEYFLGKVHWLYQDHPIEIPILDLRKL